MNRIDTLFQRKQHDILSVYFTAGYPEANSTVPVIRALAAEGVDMVEIGIPFSDPLADGPVIQESSSVALRNGMTLSKLLAQVKEARAHVPEMPFVLMGYLNPIMQYGVERLFRDARAAGIDAMIVPDLPFDEYLANFSALCQEYGIHMVMLITPETSEERIRLIDAHCSGFIYMVSVAGTTGAREGFTDAQTAYFRRIDAMGLKHPRLIGFGISNPTTFRAATAHSHGAIVGSHFIRCLQTAPNPATAAKQLVDSLT